MLILLHYTTEIARFFHSNLGNVGLNRGCAHGSDCLMKLDEVNHYS